jgi:hypothetical protein
MSDVNTFIDAIGKDVSSTVAPRLDALTAGISATVRDFALALIQDLSQRYHPELTGELHARIVQGGLEVTGQNVRLDLKRRDTGAAVASLDIPVSMKINVADLAVNLQKTTIKKARRRRPLGFAPAKTSSRVAAAMTRLASPFPDHINRADDEQAGDAGKDRCVHDAQSLCAVDLEIARQHAAALLRANRAGTRRVMAPRVAAHPFGDGFR